jgi:hypothetical protein
MNGNSATDVDVLSMMLNVDNFVALVNDGEVSVLGGKVILTYAAKQHAKNTLQTPAARFENMFPDGDEDSKLRIKDLERQLLERDREEMTRRQSIAELQAEVAKREERIEELEALGEARDRTINTWCDRAESFGVRDLAGLTAVSEDYKALRTLMCAEPGVVCPEVERLKMKLLHTMTGKSELRAKAVREAAIAFKHATRPSLDGRTMSGRAHDMDATGRILDEALADEEA